MKTLILIVGYLRTVLVAALVLAFVDVGLSSAHAMPCYEMSHATSDALGLNVALSKGFAGHPKVAKHGEPGAMHPDRCCIATCVICLAAFPEIADHTSSPVAGKHAVEYHGHLAGIILGPPHGPPRS